MKKFFIALGSFIVVAVLLVIAINFYVTHKTRYLNYQLNALPYADAQISYIQISEGININAYPNQTEFRDKRIINKIFDYLNNIPMVYVPYKVSSPLNNARCVGKCGTIRFFNKDGIETDWLQILSEEYVLRGYDMRLLKVRDEGTHIISGLEGLELY